MGSASDDPRPQGLPPLADCTWLEPQRAQLREARAQGRLPSGLLVRGLPGGGAGALARIAAQAALCREPGAPCGQCNACVQVEEGRHPDFWVVAPEGDSRQIRVDQVRELADTLSLTGYSGGATAAVLEPAEAMNANAANALLKTLEEPRPGVLIVLVAGVAARLPATIVSRCQRLTVQPPSRAGCLAWLRQHGNPEGDWEAVLDVVGLAPLRALECDPAHVAQVRREVQGLLEEALAGQGDFAAAADRWGRQDFELRLACAENWVTERLLRRFGAAGNATEARPQPRRGVLDSAPSGPVLVRLADALRDMANQAHLGLNRALAVEQLLWQLAAAGRADGSG